MKKIVLFLAFAAIGFAAHAKSVSEVKTIKTTVVFEKKNATNEHQNIAISNKSKKVRSTESTSRMTTYPSGTFNFTDGCGNEWVISWSCNYDCSDFSVLAALSAWGIANIDPACYVEE